MKNGLVIHEYGSQRWYLNDQLHRTDGPAVIYPSGSVEYYKNGRELPVDAFNGITPGTPEFIMTYEML